MDPSVAETTLPIEEDDEWACKLKPKDPDEINPVFDVSEINSSNTDGFVIPSLELGDRVGDSETETPKPPSPKAKAQENIYLGPHGAPPSQTKQQQDSKPSSRKQRFKQKLKEADLRISGSGRENKMANLRELVGGGGKATNTSMPKGSSREWLDPHCHESQFEKWHYQ